jgi:hypothetical protein
MTFTECLYDPPADRQPGDDTIQLVGSPEIPIPFVGDVQLAQIDQGTFDPLAASTIRPIDGDLERAIERWVRWLQHLSRVAGSVEDEPIGTLQWIGSLGIAPGSPRSTYHNHLKAIDINWIQFENLSLEVTRVGTQGFDDPRKRRVYVGVEATLRKYFGYVLNYRIPNHDNHWHVDNADGDCRPGFKAMMGPGQGRSSTSVVYFLRDCVAELTDLPLPDDESQEGEFTVALQQRWTEMFALMGLDCDDSPLDPQRSLADYVMFLDLVALLGLTGLEIQRLQPLGRYLCAVRARRLPIPPL